MADGTHQCCGRSWIEGCDCPDHPERPNLKALSADVEDPRVLRLHFAESVTNETRRFVVDAWNLALAAGQWTPHQDYSGEPMEEGEFRDPPCYWCGGQGALGRDDKDRVVPCPDRCGGTPRTIADLREEMRAVAASPKDTSHDQ